MLQDILEAELREDLEADIATIAYRKAFRDLEAVWSELRNRILSYVNGG